MQTIMPRWLNNVLVMAYTAMTIVLMIVILVLLAKHFKMKALVSMLAIFSLPPLIEAVNFTAAVIAYSKYVGYLCSPTTDRSGEFYSNSDSICSGSSKPSNWNKSSVYIPSSCNVAKYTWIFGISSCNSSVFQASYLVQRI